MLDRRVELRTDSAWLEAARRNPDNRVLWVHRGRCAMRDPQHLRLDAVTEILGDPELTLLGDIDGTVIFAAHVDDANEQWLWHGLRELGDLRDDRELAITAIALDNWLRSHTHCSRCGARTEPITAGWARRCPVDNSQHFPRTDPAIIVLVIDGDDRALLGRQGRWQPGWFSTLAGFIEPGETAEQAVRREVAEEVGIAVGLDGPDVRYITSQPWPFPNSLMLGYFATATSTQITVDGEEIVEAHWFSREELEGACAEGTVRLPPAMSVARTLIERWFGSPLPGDWLR